MTKVIKTISKVVLGMVIVAGSFALANPAMAATFNTQPGDFPVFRAANSNQQQGTFNWTTSVSANSGETIAFIISFHNTSGETAVDTRVRAILPTAPFSSATIFGEVFAQNASSNSGSVSVSLSGSQTLTFVPGTAQFFTGVSATPTSFPGGQNGDAVVTISGLSLGNIPADGRGFVVFRALVGQQVVNNQAPTVITDPASNISRDNNDFDNDFNDEQATLNGRVNPNGSNTTAFFEWGTTQSLGNVTNSKNVGSGTTLQSVNEQIKNLQPNTTYFFRIVAQNQFGTSRGQILSFTTLGQVVGQLPSVTTNPATNIFQNTAVLNGTVNPNGSPTDVRFEWGFNSQSLSNQTNRQQVGSGNFSINFSDTISSFASNNSQIFFRAVAQNQFGEVRGQILSFISGGQFPVGQPPFVITNQATNITSNSATLNASVNPNGGNTTAFFEFGTTQSLGFTTGFQNVSSGNFSNSFSASAINLSPGTTYFFRVVAQNEFGINRGQILSFTTSGIAQGNVPTVRTNPATFIFQNSALLNGSVTPNGSLTTGWFEWGRTASLGNRTNEVSIGSAFTASPMAFALTGLSSNTTYFFRAVGRNAFGTTFGDTISFTTQSAPIVVTPPTTPVITVINAGGEQLVTLTPAVDNPNPRAGEEIAFTVVYRNEGSTALTNAVLKIVLPSEVSYVVSNPQPSLVEGNNLRYDIGRVAPHSQGIVSVKVRIGNSTDAGSALVFNTTLDYTDSRNRFQSVNAFLTVVVREGGSVLGSVFTLLKSLFGNWLFDLLLGLVIGFGIYHFFVKAKDRELAS